MLLDLLSRKTLTLINSWYQWCFNIFIKCFNIFLFCYNWRIDYSRGYFVLKQFSLEAFISMETWCSWSCHIIDTIIIYDPYFCVRTNESNTCIRPKHNTDGLWNTLSMRTENGRKIRQIIPYFCWIRHYQNVSKIAAKIFLIFVCFFSVVVIWNMGYTYKWATQ